MVVVSSLDLLCIYHELFCHNVHNNENDRKWLHLYYVYVVKYVHEEFAEFHRYRLPHKFLIKVTILIIRFWWCYSGENNARKFNGAKGYV